MHRTFFTDVLFGMFPVNWRLWHTLCLSKRSIFCIGTFSKWLMRNSFSFLFRLKSWG
jgi:hypothetical protein